MKNRKKLKESQRKPRKNRKEPEKKVNLKNQSQPRNPKKCCLMGKRRMPEQK